MEPVLAERIRPLAEKLKAAQDAADLQRFNDRYSSLVQSVASGDRLQARLRFPVEIRFPQTADREASSGPTPYEAHTSGEDAWE